MDNKLQIQIVQNLVPVLTADVTTGGGKNITFGDTMTGTGTPNDPINVSNSVLQQISDNAEQSTENASKITEIQRVIPATANSQNQLADQGFVNSSIQTATAYFRGDWATWADVPSDPALYPADATGNHTPITNDYMVVIADEQENGGTWRYKYTGLWSEQGKAGWLAEYQVNETPLTAAQLAALNSGVTADAVASFVKNTDYATANKAGIVKPNTSYGLETTATGELRCVAASESNIASRAPVVRPITPQNFDYAVKVGVTTNTIALTDEEKTAVRTWIGAVGNTDYGTSIKAGLIKGYQASGFSINGVGEPYPVTKTLENYSASYDMLFVSKGTLENIKDDYVKRGITANTITLTDEEKAAAQAWLGVESGGGASLPDQTGNAGKFLMTDGTDVRWQGYCRLNDGVSYSTVVFDPAGKTTTDITSNGLIAIAPSGNTSSLSVNLLGAATGLASVAIGFAAKTYTMYSVSIGASSYADGLYATALGYSAKANADGAIQLGNGTNSDANTFKVANANGNFKMMDANGNVPLERLTYVTDQIGDISTALTAILGE